MQIALAMVLLASLGATTAFRGAFAEMESGQLERKLDQGRLLDLYVRQDLTDSRFAKTNLKRNRTDTRTPPPK
jgi:hypothetical protein